MNELISRAKQGDRLAMTEIYNRTYKELAYYCLKLCGNAQDSEDLIQDTYLTAFEKLSQYQRDESFKGWLHTIAFHKYYNRLRDEKPCLFTDEPESTAEEELCCPEEYAENREIYQIIMNTISRKLTEPQRLTVIMYYYDEKSVSEIAKELECAEGTVKSRLYYSRRVLRNELVKNGFTVGGGLFVLGMALRAGSAEFIAGTAVNTAALSSVLGANYTARRAAARAVGSFTKRKLIAGLATVAVAAGVAAVGRAAVQKKKAPVAPNVSESSEAKIPTAAVPTAVRPTSSSKTEAAVTEQPVTEAVTGISKPGGTPVEYDFPGRNFVISVPDDYAPDISAIHQPDGSLSEADIEKNEKIFRERRYIGLSSHRPLRFYPDKFSGDRVIISFAQGNDNFTDEKDVLSGYFSEISVDPAEQLFIHADNSNNPGAATQITADRIGFTAKSNGKNVDGTLIRCVHNGGCYIFIFADCSGIRHDEYEAIIDSIGFYYTDNSWREDYPHFAE